MYMYVNKRVELAQRGLALYNFLLLLLLIQPSQLNYMCHSCGKSDRSGYSPLLAENIHIIMHTDAPGGRRKPEERG